MKRLELTEEQEELILDLLCENFPWLEDLLYDDEKPIEDLINFLGSLAYSYGFKEGKEQIEKTIKTFEYGINEKPIKIYEN